MCRTVDKNVLVVDELEVDQFKLDFLVVCAGYGDLVI